ncbi:kinase-like protein [Punctularia strigosozonata HHB-11173 SS5]|uniref:kinase-like protein n=1 Tax=Punctularia strigosozonata (strain HHB-11173) TaxID=741275 RepID=UPI00044179EC|nr:kinase-like protein [Punctularia strigosozonata HHB-11173 SS5]EIN08107.1 kinase-like protein [Punctularia strigosozonata HHB-11173 SS5]
MMTTRQSSSLLLQAMWCSFEDPTSVFIVMPLQRCSLRDRLAMSKDTPITPGDQILYMAEMVQALEDLHALNIVHRDLKPDNFLLNKKGHVVLSDFGVAHQFGHSHRSMWKLGGAAGDFYYMAPEMHPISPPGDPVVKFGSYDERADIWSLGLTFLQMALGLKKNFFIAIMEQDGGSRHVEGPPSFEAIQGALCGLQDSYLHNLLVWMLRKDPESRPSLTKVKHHDYFHNVNWEQVKSHSFGDRESLSMNTSFDRWRMD